MIENTRFLFAAARPEKKGYAEKSYEVYFFYFSGEEYFLQSLKKSQRGGKKPKKKQVPKINLIETETNHFFKKIFRLELTR